MKILTKEEVLHVAHLAKIKIDENEIEKYQVELAQLIADIDKIKDIEIEEENLLVTPVDHQAVLRNDNDTNSISFNEVKNNIPKVVGNFVEVPVMVNE